MSLDRQIEPQGVCVALIIGASIVASTAMAGSALVRVKSGRESIQVTGSARQSIRSNLIIWRARVVETAPTAPAAYRLLQDDVTRTQQFLARQGVKPTEVFPQAISTTALHPTPQNASQDTTGTDEAKLPVVGYRLSEDIEVRSRDVGRVDEVARRSTELIRDGVNIQSEAPQYIYTEIGTLKVKILATAARDAHTRAEEIARASGAHLGELRSARMGVIQIEGLYDSGGIEDSGANDTSSLYKKVTSVVHASYAIR